MLRRLPFFKLLAVAEVALLARRHLGNLAPDERRRLAELVRRGRRMGPEERRELRELVMRLEPRAFAVHAVDRMSPVPLPKKRLSGRRR